MLSNIFTKAITLKLICTALSFKSMKQTLTVHLQLSLSTPHHTVHMWNSHPVQKCTMSGSIPSVYYWYAIRIICEPTKVWRIVMFLKGLRLHLFDQKFSQDTNIMKWLQLKIFFYIYFKWYMYSCDGKAEFPAAITSVFSVTWYFRNHS